MASMPMKDCATPLEDARLLHANDYMKLVSSGISGLAGGGGHGGHHHGGGRWGGGGYGWGGPYWGGGFDEDNVYVLPVVVGTSGLGGLSGKTQDIPVTQWGYAGWPPGPRPHPYKWTDPRTGTTWTRSVMDGKWLYQSSVDERYYITASNLYELQGLKKDTDGLIVESPKGKAEPEHWWEQEILGVKAGWLAALGVGGYLLCQKRR